MPNQIQLGAQTNAWPIDAKRIKTFYQILDRIHELGLAGFETGFRNFEFVQDSLDAVALRIRQTGLTFFGIHIFLSTYDEKTHIAAPELYNKVAATGAALGAKHLILSGAPSHSDTELAAKAAGLNEAGEAVARKGLTVGYHNHAPEFADNAREISYLIEHTNPQTVGFVVDAGHAFRAGADVPSFLSTYANRVFGVHLRDSRNGKEVPLGQSDFPLKETADALRNTNWNGWALLEEERADGSKPGDHAIVPATESLRRAFS